MSNSTIKNCCAVCVTYNPSVSLLTKVMKATIPQVDKIYIIDNGSKIQKWAHYFSNKSIKIVLLNKNLGIAHGLNNGIQLALESAYKYVLLLDQDSIPPDGMVNRYCEVMRQLYHSNKRVAAIGPRYLNEKMGNISRFVRFKWFHNNHYGSDDELPIVRADFLITSGSFYDLSVFNDIGLFNNSFFIDHVDTEWCNRATSKGFEFYGIWDVVMKHSLGEDGLRLWFFRWRVQPIHKAFRLYFIMRNSILMYRMPHSSKKWISGDILRLLRLSFMYLFFVPGRMEHFKWLRKGLIDGLKGITGGEQVIKPKT